MSLIVVIAADLAALRPFFLLPPIFEASYPWFPREPEFLPPRFPNLGIVFIILVLEIDLFDWSHGRERNERSGSASRPPEGMRHHKLDLCQDDLVAHSLGF